LCTWFGGGLGKRALSLLFVCARAFVATALFVGLEAAIR
jgi:hypothetical protein